MTRRLLLWFRVASAGLLVGASPVMGQHVDVLVQSLDGRLTTGSADFDTGAWTLGTRVYRSEFDSDFAVNNPGFNALSSGSGAMPSGAVSLPGNMPLRWDFLPMKINGLVANLFYWDGAGTSAAEVEFGAPPGPGYKLSLFGKNAAVGVDGADLIASGDVIDDTSSSGVIHRHRFFSLDDGDGNPATSPADGIYLISLRLAMSVVDRSAPTYFVWGTPGSTLSALSAADAWTQDRAALLTPDAAADFDGDLDVDGADFLTWQRGFGAVGGTLQIAGDASRDRAVSAVDFDAWSDEFGSNLGGLPGTVASMAFAIPEPPSWACPVLAAMAGAAAMRRRGVVKRHWSCPGGAANLSLSATTGRGLIGE